MRRTEPAWYTHPVGNSAADLRRRVMGWRAAERRDHALRALEGPLDPASAMDAAFEIYDLFATTADAPDGVRLRELAGARAAWRKVRERLACRHATPMPR